MDLARAESILSFVTSFSKVATIEPRKEGPMSAEDLEKFESEVELALYQEYRAVLSMFRFVVETDRRFYLANEVKIEEVSGSTPMRLRVLLRDAWVWDMYRPVRFVESVVVETFKDVNIEELPHKEGINLNQDKTLDEI